MWTKKDSQLYINIAPLVDVMLVLLVIFMVTAPMMQTTIDVNLPKTDEGHHSFKKQSKIVVISMDKKGRTFVNDQKVDLQNLSHYLKKNIKKDDQIQLKADESLQFNKVFNTIDKLVKSGYSKLSLVAEIK